MNGSNGSNLSKILYSKTMTFANIHPNNTSKYSYDISEWMTYNPPILILYSYKYSIEN